MYWHASELFLDRHEAKRALALLRKNVALRPNGTSFVALARAELADGRCSEAKASIDTALAMPPRSGLLFVTAARVYRALGEGTAADAFLLRARALDPTADAKEADRCAPRGDSGR